MFRGDGSFFVMFVGCYWRYPFYSEPNKSSRTNFGNPISRCLKGTENTRYFGPLEYLNITGTIKIGHAYNCEHPKENDPSLWYLNSP